MNHTPYQYPISQADFQQMSLIYELYSYGAQFSQDVVFKIDIINTTVIFLGNNLKYFKSGEVVPDYLNLVARTNLIYGDDKEAFAKAVDDLKYGIITPLKFRLQYQDGQVVWYRAQYDIIKNDQGIPIAAAGKINNIQENQELVSKASLDLLTGCLNKGTFESYARNLLKSNPLNMGNAHSLIIIDIDNFKAVNDNLGHFYGDIVLKEIASKLKRIFRETDYIGRIGGDEFAVVMKSTGDTASVIKKVREVVDAINATYQGPSNSYHITGSVGIACYPQHGNNYDDLYIHADAALYHSKFQGKNTYSIYSETLVKGTMVNSTPFDMANRALSHHFDQEVAMDTFSLLFEAENYETSIQSVLRHLGTQYHVDRCYIFEVSPDNFDIYDNTYEWCREGIEPQKGFLQGVDKSAFAVLFNSANSEGVYYCNDISSVEDPVTREMLEVQDIQSFLHTFIKRNDVVHYAIGFDDCTVSRIWTPREISTLMYASKIIAQFLFYKRALATVHQRSRENLDVLDSLNFYAYIVDAETKNLKYLNHLTKALVPQAQVGKLCYQVLRGNQCECDDCPLRILRENPTKSKVRMIIHNEKLHMDVLVTASRLLNYDGRDSVFVSSTNIKEIVEALPPELQRFRDVVVVD